MLRPLEAVLPNRGRHWVALHAGASRCLRVLGIPPSVTGTEHVPPDGAVANHSSYLDGLVLSPLFARAPVFVAKQELTGQFVA